MNFIDELVKEIVHRNLLQFDLAKIKEDIEQFKNASNVFILFGTNKTTVKKTIKEKIQIHGDNFIQMEEVQDFVEKELFIIEEEALVTVFYEWLGEKRSVEIKLPERVKKL